MFMQNTANMPISDCHSLRIEKQMMHNIVKVKKTLWVGNKDKADGKLIAGNIRVGESVHAGTVGATAGSMTTLPFLTKCMSSTAK